MKKNRVSKLIFLLILLGILGGGYWCCHNYAKNRQKLKDLIIDDTLYADEIASAARKHDLPPELVRAVIKKESSFRKDHIGDAGEIGLMQVLPRGAAAEWARVNKCAAPGKSELMRVETNLDIGCWYLARCMKKWSDYRHGMELALAEYNAGGKNSARWKPEKKTGEVIHRIDFPTTRKYVTDIMHDYREYLIEKEQNSRTKH
jgi:soluble lytic murein transglycosylase